MNLEDVQGGRKAGSAEWVSQISALPVDIKKLKDSGWGSEFMVDD